MDKKLITKAVGELNARILKEMETDARLSITEIGKRVGLSGPAVSERIKKMEDEGIITGYTTVVDHDQLGLAVNAFITLKSSLTHSGVIKKIEEVPEILECYSITGNHCIIMKVATSTTKRLEAIIGHLQQFGETNTSVILSATFEKRGIFKSL
ncbi:Lrp/AsnC family transcriptional regulator [Mucilaginibacter aquariorum]|uniref:Lrp/AsnC family transcriptional regulator n=1 Tax=Mucilaginibacter aquariorum TaxID=2967225 RepID=A0ABT1SZ08_9SPHI|nr:Lrp/AsnC family transcriptional regulator [Mucilaginibacter aquariorum]MCQ6957572.1 Lrp/AsnC family transcriptional regulator [Mucilaginibacter aquariorum]